MAFSASSTYRSDLLARPRSPALQGVRFLLVLGAHVALLWLVMELAARPEVRQAAQDLIVRLIETRPPEAEIRPPEPLPVPRPQPVQRTVPIDSPRPVLTAAPEASAPEAPAIAPAPPAPPVEAVSAPAVVTAARFDADYLSNPKPVYPVASRRLSEEGKVLLRVKVSPGGTALAIEVKQSSGFSRLDEAARAAVMRWKFVPARRGDEAIESWVAVPIAFSLQDS